MNMIAFLVNAADDDNHMSVCPCFLFKERTESGYKYWLYC